MNLILRNKKIIRRQKGNEWNALVVLSPAPQGLKEFERKYFGLGFLRIEVPICKFLGALLFKKRHWLLSVNFMLHFSRRVTFE